MTTATLSSAHVAFEAALPTIDSVIHFAFRKRPFHEREEAAAEATARCWKTFCALVERGRDPLAVGVTAVAGFAVRHVLNGRKLGNPINGGRGARDIFHPRARRQRDYKIISLDDRAELIAESGPTSEIWKDWLAADTRPSPADQATFRIDFRTWLEELPERKRHIAEQLAGGYSTGEVPRELGVTAPAISQTRTALARSWHAFQGEAVAERAGVDVGPQ